MSATLQKKLADTAKKIIKRVCLVIISKTRRLIHERRHISTARFETAVMCDQYEKPLKTIAKLLTLTT